MKQQVRKILSLTTAAALTLGMVVTAHAADSGMTRGEMAKLLVEGAGLSGQAAEYAAKNSAFQDVAEGSAYEGYINLAYEKGLMSGTGSGSFRPDAKTTQLEAAAAVMQYAGVPDEMLKAWPADYEDTAVRVGLTAGLTFDGTSGVTQAQFETMLKNGSALIGKPYIGISWKSSTQNYDSFKTVIRAAGGNPVELDQVTSTAVAYDKDGKILDSYLEESGMLKQKYADQIKAKNLANSNVGEAMAGIDGVFFTGGEDVSPSLFKVPQKEANMGEEINATRDISDYTLMAYCLSKDVPTLGACRGMQVMSIVSGTGFIQDIPAYYQAKGKTYDDSHRMPADAPDRDYARHVVDIIETDSWMYDIVGADKLENVSSWHHQAVTDVAADTGLTVVAKTTVDGLDIVEAVENQSKTFCLGVQFHPENDAKLALHDNKPEEAKCDPDVCLTFFQYLVSYASGKPVIGISWGGDPADYTDIQDIIQNGGGVVTHVQQITGYDQAAAEVKKVDGIVVTGGQDINSDLYGEEHSPLLEDNNEERDIRDTSDYNLIKAAVAENVPMLTICRGMQMLNVVQGGGLIQDLPTYLEKDANVYKTHRNAPDWARHDITVEAGSKWMAEIVGGSSMKNVASWHHQVLNPQKLGEGLKVTAYGPDQVIEAVEYQANEFTLGVQFHPEADALTDAAFAAYFNTLLKYAA